VGDGFGEGVGELEPECSSVWFGDGVDRDGVSGRSVGFAVGLDADPCVSAAAGALRAVLGDFSGFGAGLGGVSVACPAASIVDAARWLQTTGFALPVAATAVSASSTVAAPASAIGARRQGLKGFAIA
jgi:hypothetical protein